MSPRIAVGDVFLIPLDDESSAVGQVVGKYLSAYYLVVFDSFVEPSAPDAESALASEVIFLTLALDAKLALGHWPIIVNLPIPETVELPAYKVAIGASDQIHVEDFSGKRRRPASANEAEALRPRTVIAPVRLEKAVRARFGIQPWLEEYEELVPDDSQTTSRLLGSG